ncbi:SDR family NAD(P)-dependent oxidoreductase [Leucothrix arctica]|nr:SDR family NAD(P)-dependent oxidoreductase [Leucothrix arctica]
MKLVIITGGSKGLGEALVKEYASEKEWHVVELSRSGSSKHSIQCDFSDVKSIERLSQSLFTELIRDEWDEVIYINNAGDLKPISLIAGLDVSQIERSIAINQVSPFILLSAFMSGFRAYEGRKTIVNISSGAALKGYAGWSLYCASKAAVDNFINAAAVEEVFQDFPFIAVNYEPGVIDTSMQAEIRRSDVRNFPAKARFIELKESGNLRTAESVATDLVQKIKSGMVNQTRYSV